MNRRLVTQLLAPLAVASVLLLVTASGAIVVAAVVGVGLNSWWGFDIGLTALLGLNTWGGSIRLAPARRMSR